MSKSVIAKIVVGAIAVTAIVLMGTWLLGGFTGLSASGVSALILGVIASMFLGIGLMVAVFVSNRSGMDEATYDSTRHRSDPGSANKKDDAA